MEKPVGTNVNGHNAVYLCSCFFLLKYGNSDNFADIFPLRKYIMLDPFTFASSAFINPLKTKTYARTNLLYGMRKAIPD